MYAEPVNTHFPHVHHLICMWTSSHIQYPACNQNLREESLVGMKFVAGPEFATVVSYFSEQLKASLKQRLPITRMPPPPSRRLEIILNGNFGKVFLTLSFDMREILPDL